MNPEMDRNYGSGYGSCGSGILTAGACRWRAPYTNAPSLRSTDSCLIYFGSSTTYDHYLVDAAFSETILYPQESR